MHAAGDGPQQHEAAVRTSLSGLEMEETCVRPKTSIVGPCVTSPCFSAVSSSAPEMRILGRPE